MNTFDVFKNCANGTKSRKASHMNVTDKLGLADKLYYPKVECERLCSTGYNLFVQYWGFVLATN